MVKKIISLTAVVLIAFSVFCIPASAYSGNSTLTFGIGYGTVTGHTVVGRPSIPTSGYTIAVPSGYTMFRMHNAQTGGYEVTTTAGYYLSYYFRNSFGYPYTNSSAVTSSSSYKGEYRNHLGATGTLFSVDVKSFTPPSGDGYTNSIGITLKGEFMGTETEPISLLTFKPTGTSFMYFLDDGVNVPSEVVITSLKVVDAESQATLDALEQIADSIVEQNNILYALYGDIMEVLNAIYSQLGDLYETELLANSYFRTMIEYLSSIDLHSANIYSLLQTQFQLLIATIHTESNEIQNAIRNQTDELISYFDSTFNSAVGTLPDDNESTQGVIDDAHQNDEEYTADALGKFQEISAAFNGFNGGVGSGVAVASTLFSRVWSAMGDYVIVYTFPLMLALSLVVVGRLSRVHSNSSSNKGKGGEDNG